MNILHVTQDICGELRRAITYGPDERKRADHDIFIYESVAFYLIGCLAYLTDENDNYLWNGKSNNRQRFDEYTKQKPCKQNGKKVSFYDAQVSSIKYQVSSSSLDALQCLRNAIVHNGCDLDKNRDKNSTAIVTNARLPGVFMISESKFQLKEELLPFIRAATIAVLHYQK